MNKENKVTQKVLRDLKIGDLYWVEFGYDSETKHGLRPAVIFQNNVGNIYSPNVKVLPMSSKMKKLAQPTHVLVPKGTGGMKRDGVVHCESPACVSKDKLIDKIGHLPDEYIVEIAKAETLSSGSLSFLSPTQLITVWERSRALNSKAKKVAC